MENANCLELRQELPFHSRINLQSKLVCRFQADGTLTYANDSYCRYFGKQQKEIVGHNFMQFVAPEDMVKIHQNIEILSQTKTYLTLEYRIVAPDNSIRRQQWTFRTLLDSAGNISEFHATTLEAVN